jgi:hypothetical protein
MPARGALVIDRLNLSRKMKRLTVWLEQSGQPASLIRKQFSGVPFGEAYVTIDPTSQVKFASGNRNRVHFCGAEAGMDSGSIARLIELFAVNGVGRFFVWLSPGPDMDRIRGWIEQNGLSRIRRTGYPTLCSDAADATPAPVKTDLAVAEVGPGDIEAAEMQLGAEQLWEGFKRTAGRPQFVHTMAFDGRRPVAFAALGLFEEVGYLTAAGTVETDRKRGAQQALIARRIARARQSGCALLVSETLTMLEHSYRNLHRAGFRDAYDKEVYEWSG